MGSRWTRCGDYPAELVKTCTCGWTARRTVKAEEDVAPAIRELGMRESAHLRGEA